MQQEKEMRVVTLMIARYCRGKHGSKRHALCAECAQLLEYVRLRRSKCPFGDAKPFCSNCRIHCYKPEMREAIRAVMRYAGLRIVFRHPVLATRHLLQSKKQKKKMEREEEAKIYD